MSELKIKLQEDMKSALKAKESVRLGTVRLILNAIKQKEIDERIEATDEQVLQLLDKLISQRRESITQFSQAGRQDLVDKESLELDIIQAYLPPALTDAEVDTLIVAAIAEIQAVGIKDMGKVMALLKPQMVGRANMQVVSAKIKDKLA